MIIFLYGSDDYRREERKRFYVAEYKKKHSVLGVARFDFAEEGALERLHEFLETRSLFDSFKIAVLENIFEAELRATREALVALTKRGKETTILISEPKAPPKELAFLTKQPAIAEEYKILEGYEWEMFLRRKAKELGVTLSPSALRFLADAYKGEGYRAVTELQKLAVLDGRTIETEDLEHAGVELAPNVWSLIQALRSPDIKRRLSALEALFASREPVQKLFYILSAQWREKIAAFAACDIRIKSGKMDYEEALLELVLG